MQFGEINSIQSVADVRYMWTRSPSCSKFAKMDEPIKQFKTERTAQDKDVLNIEYRTRNIEP